MISENEQKDIDMLKQSQKDEKLKAVDYILHCKRNGVANTGYATIESLAMGTISKLEQTLKKLLDNHIRKYPDEK